MPNAITGAEKVVNWLEKNRSVTDIKMYQEIISHLQKNTNYAAASASARRGVRLIGETGGEVSSEAAANIGYVDTALAGADAIGNSLYDFFWRGQTAGTRAKRLGGYFGANAAFRYMRGGGIMTNPDGDIDIAGVPLF